jgi:uncharacterized protein YbaA (DUF1428 family)
MYVDGFVVPVPKKNLKAISALTGFASAEPLMKRCLQSLLGIRHVEDPP